MDILILKMDICFNLFLSSHATYFIEISVFTKFDIVAASLLIVVEGSSYKSKKAAQQKAEASRYV